MDQKSLQWLVCLVLLAGPSSNLCTAADISLVMPNVRPQENDLYLCIAKRIDDALLYITGFEPKASMSVAHHMLIYGCSEPGFTDGKAWSCGEMHESSKGAFEEGPVCKDAERIIYAWAMDAPQLQLPKDVAFKVGSKTASKYVVIQVHYKDVTRFLPPSLATDNSGVILKTTTVPREKTAGVYLIEANGRVSPHSVTYMEAACVFQEPLTITPIAYRVHTHKLGKVVTGYRIRDGEWTEIGRRNPQLPQMFYPVDDDQDLKIQKGDILAARCTMENKGSKTVEIGPTSDDEMCNFYIMYYLSGDQDVQDPICVSPGPPYWRWSNFRNLHPENIPFQASVDPQTNKWFQEMQQQLNDWSSNAGHQAENMQRQILNRIGSIWGQDPFYSNPGRQYPSMNDYNYQSQESGQDGYAYDEPRRDFNNYFQQYPDNFIRNNNLNKPTVLSQSPVSKSKERYTFRNGQLVKMSGEENDLHSANKLTKIDTPGMSQMNIYQQPFDMPPMPSLNFDIPPMNFDIPPMNLDIAPMPPMPAQPGPQASETFSTFNDNNGGQGSQHTKTENNFQKLNIPGGQGYIKSSSSSSSSSFSSGKSTKS